MPIYFCRGWLINTDERLLYRDGKVGKLNPRAFDVLELLISRRGETVSKDELLGIVWAGYIVEEGNLAVHVLRIRRYLKETPEAPFIETIPGIGYRFVAPLVEEQSLTWDRLVHGRSQTVGIAEVSNGPKLVVTPFENLTGDPSLGVPLELLAERLINSLSKSDDLNVLARDLAFELGVEHRDRYQAYCSVGVEYVVSGRVRQNQNHISISYEISNAVRKTQLWGGVISDHSRFEGSVLDAVADEMVFSILMAIERNGSGTLSTQIECNRLVISARHLMRRRDGTNMAAAAELLKKAISLDENFLLAYVELIECQILNFVAGYSTRAQVRTLIAPYLDSIVSKHKSNDLVLTALAAKLVFCDFDFAEAKKHLLKAIDLNPFNVRARRRLADVYLSLGELDSALDQLRKVFSIDPVSFRTLVFLGRSYYRLGNFNEALEFLNQAGEFEPYDFTVHMLVGACLIEIGDFQGARNSINRSIELHLHPDAIHMLAYIDAISGCYDSAIERAQELERQSRVANSGYLARIYAAVGDFDKAFFFLEIALDNGDPDLRGLVSDPRLVALRKDARFHFLRERLGMSLPEIP